MASSGTYNFQLTCGESVIQAFRRVRVFAPSLRQEHMVCAREEMNLMLVDFANRGVNLWKVQQTSVTLVNVTATYSIPLNVVMILDAWITINSGTSQQTDTYITPMSRTEYASLANKNTPGKPTQFWFSRTLPQTIAMYPVPDNNGPYVLNYYAFTQMQDANLAGGETPDIPYLWYDAFVASLSHRLARVYAPDLEDKRKIDAKEAWTIAAEQNTENVSLSLAPKLSAYFRR